MKTIFRITVLPGGIVYGQPIRSNETQSVAENNRASTSCRSHDVPSYFLLSPPPSTISLSRPLGQSGSRLCFVPSFFHPSLGFIRSTSILRRVAHTNVSLILLHSILYSFYSASSSSSSSSVSSSSLLFPVLCNFIESPYLPRFVSDRG